MDEKHRVGRRQFQRVEYNAMLPSKKAALESIAALESHGFYCHEFDGRGKHWYFVAERLNPEGKIDREEIALVKRIVKEEFGGDVFGWELCEPQTL